VSGLRTSLESLRSVLARADETLKGTTTPSTPLSPDPTEAEPGVWDDTLALAVAARERITRGEERIAELQARGTELESRVADEVASMTARVTEMDARYADIEKARIAAEQRETMAGERLTIATEFFNRMNQALRAALRGARVTALRAEAGLAMVSDHTSPTPTRETASTAVSDDAAESVDQVLPGEAANTGESARETAGETRQTGKRNKTKTTVELTSHESRVDPAHA
jgi:hypothetical protein